jgi:hypothetical protein
MSVATRRGRRIDNSTGPTPRGVISPNALALFAVLAVGCSALIGLQALNDNSFFTHLATGRLIVDQQSVPTSDPYAFTSGGEWVVQSWFASLFYGITDQLFGGTGLRVLTGILCAALGWISWRLTAATQLILVRAGGVAAMLVLGGVLWSERPLLVGSIAFGLTLLCLLEERSPWWLVPLYWLWVNSHGSFPLGLVLIATIWFGGRLDRVDASRSAEVLRVGRLALLGTLAGALLNPYGPKLLFFPINLLGKSDSLQHIREWQSPDFSRTWAQVFLVLIVAAVAALMNRRSWRLFVPFAVFFASALLATRNVGVASMVALPVVAYGFPGPIGVAEPNGRSNSRRRPPTIAVVLALGLFALGLVSLSEPDYALDKYPVDAVDWMVDEDVFDPDLRLAHPDFVGNYLTLRFGEDASVFIDDRF